MTRRSVLLIAMVTVALLTMVSTPALAQLVPQPQPQDPPGPPGEDGSSGDGSAVPSPGAGGPGDDGAAAPDPCEGLGVIERAACRVREGIGDAVGDAVGGGRRRGSSRS